MIYSIEEHKHRYAAWAASRASSVKGCRFSVLQGKLIIERAKLNSVVNKPDNLPTEKSIDQQHEKWCDSVIKEAEKMGLLFTHGVAAKLINVYMKTIFVCGGYDSNERVALLHPPIDEVLLKSLRNNDVGGKKKAWRKAVNKRWSKMSSNDYKILVSDIREVMDGSPLWEIEAYWQGYQSKTANK